jgi:hypothetical protein
MSYRLFDPRVSFEFKYRRRVSFHQNFQNSPKLIESLTTTLIISPGGLLSHPSALISLLEGS